MKIKTLELIPKHEQVEIGITGNKISLKYLSRKQGGSDSNTVTLPRCIEITAELARSLGIYYAEGNKSKLRRLSNFVNSEPVVIKEGMKLFELLGITKNKIKARVKVYNTDISDNDLKKYWSEITGISIENFIKTEMMPSKLNYERNRDRPSKSGRLEVIYSSVIVKDIIDNLLKKIKELSLRNTLIRNEFLKGIIAGEGSVKLVNNKLRELRISSADKNEQQFIRQLLIKEGIKPSDAEYDFYIAISGFDNFKEVLKLKLFNLHPNKAKKFVNGFNNLSLVLGE
ncbi:hypothetical protein HZC32_02960 [Candidatus Woesearchaeota archaeon]|nr:hypothetical protein [Candidatus Woesearchaeota archaeon]